MRIKKIKYPKAVQKTLSKSLPTIKTGKRKPLISIKNRGKRRLKLFKF